jgi:hypothetical protein
MVHLVWPMEVLADLANEPAACDEVAKGGVYLLGTSV